MGPELQKPRLKPQVVEIEVEREFEEEETLPPNIRSDDFLGQVTGVPTPGFDRAERLEAALQLIVKISAQPIGDTTARQRMRIVAAEALAR